MTAVVTEPEVIHLNIEELIQEDIKCIFAQIELRHNLNLLNGLYNPGKKQRSKDPVRIFFNILTNLTQGLIQAIFTTDNQ